MFHGAGVCEIGCTTSNSVNKETLSWPCTSVVAFICNHFESLNKASKSNVISYRIKRDSFQLLLELKRIIQYTGRSTGRKLRWS